MTEFIEIKLPRCVVILTTEEVSNLLQRDPELFQVGLKRGKAFTRARAKESRSVKVRK